MKEKMQPRILSRRLALTLLDENEIETVAGAMTPKEFIDQMLHNTATGPGGYSDASDM